MPGYDLNIKIKISKRFEETDAVTRIRTWVIAATTQGTNHYTITAALVDKVSLAE